VAIAMCLPAAGTAGESKTVTPARPTARGDALGYPVFSWDRIPRYMHIRKAASFTKKEIAFLARFPLITFEKATGHKAHGSVEKGTLSAARAVKKINPHAKILYYRNVIVHYGGYQADTQLKRIPGAFLKDKTGNIKLIRNRVPAYDLSNQKLRKWWVVACAAMTKHPSIDGIFLDGNIKVLEPGFLRKQIGADRKAKVLAGYHLLVRQTRKAIGPGKLMIANVIRARLKDSGLACMQQFDGSYIEGFFHNVGNAGYQEYVAKGIDAMQQAARSGKIIAFTSGLAPPKNTSKMGIDERHAKVISDDRANAGLTYALAVFLIVAEKYSYFRVHEGYSANENDRWMRWFPEYDKPLGPPAAPAVAKGPVYTRKFKHADVWLDISNRKGKITWHAR
jgi:hypothetical protein